MDGDEFPLIRLSALDSRAYGSPYRGSREPSIPPRDPQQHRSALLGDLDSIARVVSERGSNRRVKGATREIISVTAEPGYQLATGPLADSRNDVRAIPTETPERVLLDSPSAQLPHLRRKLDEYGDDTKVSEKTGARKNSKALDPIRGIRLSTLDDRAALGLQRANLGERELVWTELACRGGRRRPQSETISSRNQLRSALRTVDRPNPAEFIATEQVYFLVRATVEELRHLMSVVDCVYSVELITANIRDWYVERERDPQSVQDVEVAAPPEDASAVVLLDTGVTTRHPLLTSTIRSAISALPDDTSPEDTAGHGTSMAGIALWADLADKLVDGVLEATHWLDSAKILNQSGVGSASEDQRLYWPAITQVAVAGIEQTMKPRRVFTLATTASFEDGPRPTSWSHSLDQLAFNDGTGRLFVVATGNADFTDQRLIDGYPSLYLEQKLENPAQAINAITVGGYTELTSIPRDDDFRTLRAVAPAGGISPYTRAGGIGATEEAPSKPDIVFEAGNLATDGQLPDSGAITLLTTSNRPNRYLTGFNMTSASAACGARFAAQLWNHVPDAAPQTIRGLMIHSASWTSAMENQFPSKDERFAICGYGVPDLDFARCCVASRATVFVEDSFPNAVKTQTLKDPPPKRPSTDPYEARKTRTLKFFAMPIPESELLALGSQHVELRITLSYFSEPNTFGRKTERGLDLRFDAQGPTETDEEFHGRVNRLARSEDGKAPETKSFDWIIGKNRRGRGTVQSDRWVGPASLLAGSKAIAVYPVLGWWDARKLLEYESMKFSLIVSVVVDGLDIYTPIKNVIEGTVAVAT